MNNRKLAAFLARRIFDVGCGHGAPTQRIALKGGSYPDHEIDRGGLNEDALTRILQEALNERPTQQHGASGE